jgi:hypothetical protein
MVIARALDADGAGNYANVIAAIDWIVSNKDRYKIRVLNLSIYAPVDGPYWADPLNQAVMRAWQAGIVVVTVAGNSGPSAGTITAPGNVPYVITVGALKSKPGSSGGTDELANFSARGPTESAFVKPDLVVPASRTLAPMPDASRLAGQLQSAKITTSTSARLFAVRPIAAHSYYYMSGTSMAAAQVTAVVALMLQEDRTLSNDQVKYRLLSTAVPQRDSATGRPTYSIWEQGAGRLNAESAIFSTETASANDGMNIALDLGSSEHYWGYTTFNEVSGEFSLSDPATQESLETWAGGRRTTAGTWVWSGGRRTTAGSWIWASGRRTTAGSWIWASGRRTTAGSLTALAEDEPASKLNWAGDSVGWLSQIDPADSGGPSANVVLDDPDALPQRVYLPMMINQEGWR